jgi:hypothetical protein
MARIRRSFLFIDNGTGTDVVQVHYFTLPDATRNLDIKVLKRPARFSIRSFGLFGILMLTPILWRLIYLQTQKKVICPHLCLYPSGKSEASRVL